MFEADKAIYISYKLCFENILSKCVHIYIDYLFFIFYNFYIFFFSLP